MSFPEQELTQPDSQVCTEAFDKTEAQYEFIERLRDSLTNCSTDDFVKQYDDVSDVFWSLESSLAPNTQVLIDLYLNADIDLEDFAQYSKGITLFLDESLPFYNNDVDGFVEAFRCVQYNQGIQAPVFGKLLSSYFWAKANELQPISDKVVLVSVNNGKSDADLKLASFVNGSWLDFESNTTLDNVDYFRLNHKK